MGHDDQKLPFPIDDIPEARREKPGQLASQSRLVLPWQWGIVGAIATASLAVLLLGALQYRRSTVVPVPLSSSLPSQQTNASTDLSTADSSGTATTLADSNSPEANQSADQLLGHRAYEEAPSDSLVPITQDGKIKLRKAAAEKYQAMVAQARSEGVYIYAISGYRSKEEQRQLFFDVKAERGESSLNRAEVSAPPGYSEHHTGFAVDLGDAQHTETELEPEFTETPAFKWLQKNAAHYSFELSFTEGNAQGLSYEPWHWRFVGDPESLETFYKQR